MHAHRRKVQSMIGKESTMTYRTLVQLSLATSLFAGVTLAMAPIGQLQSPTKSGMQASPIGPKVIYPLSPLAAQNLIHMREEEKVARDVYAVLGMQWNAGVFNITNAEQVHMDAMKNMLDRFGLTDPIIDDTIGVFPTPAFAELYAFLLDLGSDSVVDAYKVGALIEELDLVDLRIAALEVQDPVLIHAYEELMRGTRNHLRAFAARIYAAGETYEAQYLTQEEFDAIANSDNEPGGN